MADTKISALAAVTSLGDTDEAVLAVSGASKKITGANIRASSFDATSPSTQAIGDSAVVGTATTAAHRDHKHAMPAFATPAIVLGSSAAAGSAATLIRSDGTIAAFDTTVPTTQAFADAAAIGTAAFAARRDHSHAMPANPIGISWTIVTKTSDTSATSNTTLANDAELFFTATSGAMYEIELALIYANPLSAGTPDFKIAVGEDNTLRGGFNVQGGITNADAVASAALQSQQNANATYGTAAANRILVLRGSHQGAGGTFRLLWAQGVSDGNPTTLRSGSLLRYRRIF